MFLPGVEKSQLPVEAPREKVPVRQSHRSEEIGALENVLVVDDELEVIPRRVAPQFGRVVPCRVVLVADNLRSYLRMSLAWDPAHAKGV